MTGLLPRRRPGRYDPPVPKPPRTPVDKLARRVAKTSQKVVGVPRPRRTQAERRAATRTALLDAALVSLVDDGYANMTTRRVAERAGVSQGTQQHYFATKAEFVGEAMRYAVQQIAGEVLQRIDLSDVRDPAKQEELLDEIWHIHRSRAFKAALELWIAARTDEELRRNMRKLEREVRGLIADTMSAVAPEEARDPIAAELLDIALAAVRGFAMLAPVVPQAELDRRWQVTRRHLAAVARAHLEARAT